VNGISITGYEVSNNNGATWITASSNAEHTFSGLTNVTDYCLSVRAIFDYGYGIDATLNTMPGGGTTTTYNVSIATFGNGTVTADKAACEAGEMVTLTLSSITTNYELASIEVHKKNSNTDSNVALNGSGTGNGAQYTFTMPEDDVTVTATFKKTDDQIAVETAKDVIESATSYTVAQATANTEADVKTWLAGEINALPGMSATGITVIASNIATNGFSAATAGTSGNENGGIGSFNFTVSLSKGSSSLTTESRPGTITATVYTPPATYTVAFSSIFNGNVTASPSTPSVAGTPITLTITPDAGYEPDVISACKTGEQATTVPLSVVNATTRTFTMPAYNVTVTATFKKTQAQLDKETLEAAKTAIEKGTYNIAQAAGNTEAELKAWLVNTLNALFGQSHDIQFRLQKSIVGNLTINSFSQATAGTKSNPKGKDGSFQFTVTLAIDATTLATSKVSGTITANPYTEKSIELTLPAGLTVRISNTGNVSTGKLTLALSGTNANVFTLSSTTINDLAVGAKVDVTLTPRAGLALGTYTAKLTISGDGLESKSIDITHKVTGTSLDVPQVEPLKAWKQNEMLHISGLTAGKLWSVLSITGKLVYQSIADSGEANVSLMVRGVYIIKSGDQTIKVVY